jgi:hypothetical protein
VLKIAPRDLASFFDSVPSSRVDELAQLFVLRGKNSVLSLKKLKWRIDVTVASHLTSRVFKPSIILEWIFSDGSSEFVECSIEQFHELRSIVARAVHHLDHIQNHYVFKIAA